MLKNKFIIITLILLVTLTLFAPVARAEENIKKQDVYLTGKDIVIDYLIDGNLFVFGDNVTIKSQIGGDAFIIANNITIEKNGYISSNLFSCSKNLQIDGIICDAYSVSNNINIGGYIYRNANLTCSSLNLAGVIGRDAFVTSKNALNFPENSIKGNIIHKEFAPISGQQKISSYLISLGTTVATVSIIWGLCLWLAPKFLKSTNNMVSKKLLPSIGLAILAPFTVIFASTILILLNITLPIGFLIFMLFTILLLISTSIFVIIINNLICNKLKIEKNQITFGILVATAIIYWLISLIPYVGAFISLIAMITGLGIILYYIFNKDKKISATSENK